MTKSIIGLSVILIVNILVGLNFSHDLYVICFFISGTCLGLIFSQIASKQWKKIVNDLLKVNDQKDNIIKLLQIQNKALTAINEKLKPKENVQSQDN